MKFNTVVIDPPWPIPMAGEHSGRHSAAKRLPYKSMTYAEISGLDVQQLVNPGGHVYLWCTNRTLRVAYDVLDLWKLRFHQVLVMTKPSGMAPSLGYVFGTEFCLLAINGRPMQSFLKVGTLNHFSRPSAQGQHSVKPDAFYKMVETMSPGPYADIFARRKREGWSVWGDEVESDFVLG